LELERTRRGSCATSGKALDCSKEVVSVRFEMCPMLGRAVLLAIVRGKLLVFSRIAIIGGAGRT
jgi:hypothetical protein